MWLFLGVNSFHSRHTDNTGGTEGSREQMVMLEGVLPGLHSSVTSYRRKISDKGTLIFYLFINRFRRMDFPSRPKL